MRPTFWLPLAAVLVLDSAEGTWSMPSAPLAVLPPAVKVHAKGVAGDVRHHPGVASVALGNRRDVWVYLPPGYDSEPSRSYPVLYMHDGNNAFDPALAFAGHDWQVDDHAERMIRAGELSPFIVVAVSNTPDRIAEYSWIPGLYEGKVLGGKGPLYARFLVSELKPLIDRAYRTRPEVAHTAVMGSSMGGLISLYLGRHHPEVFGRIGVISPALFWADRAAFALADAMPRGLRIWVDMGAREEEHVPHFKGAIEDARELKRRLEARGYVQGKDLTYLEDAEGWHNEPTWARRVPEILRFLMAP